MTYRLLHMHKIRRMTRMWFSVFKCFLLSALSSRLILAIYQIWKPWLLKNISTWAGSCLPVIHVQFFGILGMRVGGNIGNLTNVCSFSFFFECILAHVNLWKSESTGDFDVHSISCNTYVTVSNQCTVYAYPLWYDHITT